MRGVAVCPSYVVAKGHLSTSLETKTTTALGHQILEISDTKKCKIGLSCHLAPLLLEAAVVALTFHKLMLQQRHGIWTPQRGV